MPVDDRAEQEQEGWRERHRREADEQNLDADGANARGVTMCACKPFGPIHVYEPGEWCSPLHVDPRTGEEA